MSVSSRNSHDSGSQSQQFYAVQVGYNKFFIDRRYTNLRPCGDGSYGFVASAVDTVTGEKVAIKKIKDAFSDSIDAKRILRELKLLRHFNTHENIITILDIMTTPTNKWDFDDIYIVTNLMESDLERIIRSRQHFQYFLYQILRSLKYVHSANVLHRDLKPSNILVNANCDLAICDFGLARGFHVEGQDTLTEYVVTRWYRAPELLCEAAHYGKGIDIWSVGCIFAELLTHEAFFRGDNPQHQLELIVRKMGVPPPEKLDFITSQAALNSILACAAQRPPGPFNSYFPSTASPLALDLLQQMLRFHPDDRVSVEAALAHPYLREFHGQMPEPTCTEKFDFQFEQVDYDLSAEDIQYHMYCEMLLYRSTCTRFPPPPSVVSGQGRRTRRRRNSSASVASHGSHNSGNSASTGSAHYHRPHRSGSNGGGSGGDSGRGPSTTSSSRSGDGRGAKDVPPHPVAFDDGGLKQLGPFGEEEDTGMALASPWTAAMAQGKNAHAFFPEGKDDDDAMLTARSSSMGYGMPLGGGSAADCKGVPGAAAGPGPGAGLARHGSNPADHSFGSMGSLGDMDIDHLDQFLDAAGAIRVDAKDGSDTPGRKNAYGHK